MVKITITVEDETLDFKTSKQCETFVEAVNLLPTIADTYIRRQELELK